MIFAGMLFTLWYTIWTMLSWPLDGREAFLGIAVSAFVTFMTIDLEKHAEPRPVYGVFSIIKRLGYFAVYLVMFLWECVRANIDVAFRVFPPEVPVRPGTLKIKTSLKSDIALTFLANSVTLTPGTTTIDVDKENGYIYVHWLYLKEEGGKAVPRMDVVTKFDNIIKKIFE